MSKKVHVVLDALIVILLISDGFFWYQSDQLQSKLREVTSNYEALQEVYLRLNESYTDLSSNYRLLLENYTSLQGELKLEYSLLNQSYGELEE